MLRLTLPIVLYFNLQEYSDANGAAERLAIRKCLHDKVECESLPVTSPVNSLKSANAGLNDNMLAVGDSDDSDSEAFRVRRRSTVDVNQSPDDVRICFPEQQVTSLFLLSPFYRTPLYLAKLAPSFRYKLDW